MEQLSEKQIAWESARIAKLTASGISPLFVNGKGELFGVGAKTYIREKVHEVLSQTKKPSVKFAQGEYGKKWEPEARFRFEEYMGINPADAKYYGVEDPQFFPDGDYAGGSPDWELLSLEEGADFKCPFNGGEHLINLSISSVQEFKMVRNEYWHQGQMNMYIRGWKRFHFVSYDPRMLEKRLRLKIITMLPDTAWQNDYRMRRDAAIDAIKAAVKIAKTYDVHVGQFAGKEKSYSDLRPESTAAAQVYTPGPNDLII